MFNIGGGEFLVIALVALIVLGPQRLPDAARQAGRAMAELRRISSGFQTELHNAMSEVEASSARTPGAAAALGATADTASSERVAPAVAAVSAQARARRVPLKAAPTPPSPRNGTPSKGRNGTVSKTTKSPKATKIPKATANGASSAKRPKATTSAGTATKRTSATPSARSAAGSSKTSSRRARA